MGVEQGYVGSELTYGRVGYSPTLLVPSIGVIVIGCWPDGYHLATYTGWMWLVERDKHLEYRSAPITYHSIAESLVEGREYGKRQ